jgi:hypothetical protein
MHELARTDRLKRAVENACGARPRRVARFGERL